MVPIYLSIAVSMLVANLGVAALSGVGVLVLSLYLNGKMMKRLHALRTTQLTQTDDRVKQTNEAILGIRVVKLYAVRPPRPPAPPPGGGGRAGAFAFTGGNKS
jgi:hypothetical protein